MITTTSDTPLRQTTTYTKRAYRATKQQSNQRMTTTCCAMNTNLLKSTLSLYGEVQLSLYEGKGWSGVPGFPWQRPNCHKTEQDTSFALAKSFLFIAVSLFQYRSIATMQEVDRPDMNGSMNLTPTSDGATGNSAAPSLPSLRVSSTQASVDSESDYQMTTSSAVTTTASASSASTSRPLSRSSSVVSGTSALSTTATKDGVEGKKVRRFHDPLGYTAWLKSTNNARQFDDDNGSTTAFGTGSGAASGIGAGDGSGETTPSVNSGDSDGHKTPPNIPSAPPVTLNEKMRLLRTGSVSGHGHQGSQGSQGSSSSHSDNSASA